MARLLRLPIISGEQKSRNRIKTLIRIIKAAGSDGIPRGLLIYQSGIAANQWQFYKRILDDLPGIKIDEDTHSYYWDNVEIKDPLNNSEKEISDF